MSRVFIAAAKRSAVIPRGGAFKPLQADEIAAPVIETALAEAGIPKNMVDQVIMGNALYGGGNPARMAALRAGLPENVPAMTLDTQCCSGMDALHYGAALIKSGTAKVVLVGGLESYSRSPIRMHRPLVAGEEPDAYDRPPFAPWADRDPDMLTSAATLSRAENCTREQQQKYAAHSHEKSVFAVDEMQSEIVPILGQKKDAFSRPMSERFMDRLPVIFGQSPFELTASTVAVEADAAAVLVLIGEDLIGKVEQFSLEYITSLSIGTDPARPALSPIAALDGILTKSGRSLEDISVFEMMEAFALQGLLMERYLGAGLCQRLNRGGGALARGHPIGASGAINLVRLCHGLSIEAEGALGIATIAAAGGLGSAVMLTKICS